MKLLTCLFFSLLTVAVRAGMPDVEMPEAVINAVDRTSAGWVAMVSGPMMVFAVDCDDASKGTFVKLYADNARIMVPVGNQLYALSPSGAKAYETRLRGMVGKTALIQMWGAALTLQAGRVVQIVAGDISLLRPQKAEAAFDLGRLMEIQTR
jgi:hypothetical protein